MWNRRDFYEVRDRRIRLHLQGYSTHTYPIVAYLLQSCNLTVGKVHTPLGQSPVIPLMADSCKESESQQSTQFLLYTLNNDWQFLPFSCSVIGVNIYKTDSFVNVEMKYRVLTGIYL